MYNVYLIKIIIHTKIIFDYKIDHNALFSRDSHD